MEDEDHMENGIKKINISYKADSNYNVDNRNVVRMRNLFNASIHLYKIFSDEEVLGEIKKFTGELESMQIFYEELIFEEGTIEINLHQEGLRKIVHAKDFSDRILKFASFLDKKSIDEITIELTAYVKEKGSNNFTPINTYIILPENKSNLFGKGGVKSWA